VLGVLRTFCEKQVKICHKHSGRFLLYIPQAVSDTELLTDLNQAMNDLSYVLPSRYTGMHVQLYGVYGLFPEDNLVGKELINQMRLAMSYQVSNQQRFFTRFDAEIVADYKKKFELSRLLLTAISKDQFSLHFQPKIDARTQKTHGSEVLLRWFEPIEFGWVSPAQFIAIAECDGQIIAIGRWVISQSCKMLKQWADKNIDVGPLAINVSGRQLKEDPGWIDYTLDCMKLNQLSASQFQFELTETYLIEDFRQCEQQLIRLRALGFEVLIDNFGVGYSSLAYLSKLPLDGVKLDKILINDVESSLGTQSMIRNITRMSHDLNLKVIAEGVETEEQFELIKKLGCDYIQGFYFSKPLTPDAFCTYLQDESKQGGQ
jgi:EAL domain-containing protein (putative c-di-GMP-specific phosphodiesterase class I)